MGIKRSVYRQLVQLTSGITCNSTGSSRASPSARYLYTLSGATPVITQHALQQSAAGHSPAALGSTLAWRQTAEVSSSGRRSQPISLVRWYGALPSHTMLEMPSLSPTMSQGNISKWRKAEGQEVAAGDVLADIETDKATVEWESMEDGFVAKLLVPEGTKDVAVGTPVAIVVDSADAVAAFKDYTGGAASSSKPAAPPAAEAAPPAAAPAAASGSSFPSHTLLAMPALSPTMSKGNIASFRKAVGDEVAAGDILAEIGTDKATMEWESQDDGVVAKWLVEEGSKDVAVGTPVVVMVDSKDEVAAFASFTAADAAGASAPKAAAAPVPAAAPAKSTAPKAAKSAPAPGGRIVASPYAKKLAVEYGLTLQGVSGSGPGGRIVAADVEALRTSGGAQVSSAPAAFGEFTDLENSQIRKVIAQRLLDSKQTAPHYYLTIDVRVDQLLKIRSTLNERLAKEGGKLSVNDFVIKAAALACKKVPEANSAWMGDFIRQYNTVDCSVAVQTPVGLMVPIVKDADSKGLLTISSDVKSLAARAKEGKLKPEEFMGGTFTISNLGMYGIKSFSAIINPPQACILAVGTTDTRVVLKNGVPENATFMSVTLSADHRVADGAVGAQWLQAFKQYMEDPYTMLL